MADRNIEVSERIARLVDEKGGTAYYVGGFVRDRLRNADSSDIDIEVHGIAPAVLEEILDRIGKRISIGESFGIYSLCGYSVDIAMPRKEKSLGRGHRDFDISVDPAIGTLKAAERRDFTVNSVMQEIITGRITDHFGGVRDIKDGIIRHVNGGTFAEDPLRVLRAACFAARFGWTVAGETVELCSRMNLSGLARERVAGELRKALTVPDRPSVFFETLRDMGQLSFWFPELEDLAGVPQDPRHHSEGDVWTHTMMVTDAAAGLRGNAKDPFGFMLAALVHDFGKAVCTKGENGKIRSVGHETTGLERASAFIGRLTSEKELRQYVLNLAEHHMMPGRLARDRSSVSATNRMFDLSADPEALICLACADNLGQISSETECIDEGFLRERLQIFREYMERPYVSGADLIAAGLEPSPEFREYLEFAHKLRLAGVERESVMRQILALEKSRKKNAPDGRGGMKGN